MLEKIIKAVVSILPKKLQDIYYKHEEAWMYIFFGALTTLVYYIARFGSRLILGDINNGAMIATIIAQITAITFAFITNKKYVFKSKTNSAGQFIKEAISFYSGRGVTFVLDLLITYIFVERYSKTFINLFSLDSINYNSSFMSLSLINGLMGSPEKMNEFIWTMLSQVMILIINYFFSKLFVFKKKNQEETAK